MQRATALVLLVLTCGSAAAACPPECMGGGGPAATDCILTWGGIASTSASCQDGASCDQDGRADGVCTFPLSACLGVDPACGVSAVTAVRVSPKSLASAGALGSAIAGLAPGACTAPGLAVPVKWKAGSTGPIRPGKVRLRVVTTADGRKDADVLTLTCQPAAPGLSAAVQPLLTARCATAACHDGFAQAPDLSAGAAHAALVGVASTGSRLPFVTAGNPKRSWVAAKITGVGLKGPRAGARMPSGCGSAANPCLTDAEIYTVLAWIQAGARND